jgi:ABC-type transporter Mla MlaB component
MLRIEKLLDHASTVLRLSGRIEEEHLPQLQIEIHKCAAPPELDLSEVSLVDRATVRFLVHCHSQGIRLTNCPLYVREWMSRERGRAE